MTTPVTPDLIKQLTSGETIAVKQINYGEPIDTIEPPHPWSADTCRSAAFALIGVGSARVLYRKRDGWWERLRAADTPEEKLTCERMINAYGEALGMNQPEVAARIASQNREAAKVKAERDAERYEREQVDKWRSGVWRKPDLVPYRFIKPSASDQPESREG